MNPPSGFSSPRCAALESPCISLHFSEDLHGDYCGKTATPSGDKVVELLKTRLVVSGLLLLGGALLPFVI